MIELVQNDTKPILRFTCKEGACSEEGTPINLSGCTVKLIFRETFASEYKFKRACDIVDPENGICEYSFQATDLDTVGNFIGELEITFSDSTIQTNYTPINFVIRKELG